MGRSVYQLLRNGVLWDSLSAAQKRRWHRDSFYYDAHKTAGTLHQAHVLAPKPFRSDVLATVGAKLRKAVREAQSGTLSHSLRNASLRARELGAISDNECKWDHQLAKRRNSAEYRSSPSQFLWASSGGADLKNEITSSMQEEQKFSKVTHKRDAWVDLADSEPDDLTRDHDRGASSIVTRISSDDAVADYWEDLQDIHSTTYRSRGDSLAADNGPDSRQLDHSDGEPPGSRCRPSLVDVACQADIAGWPTFSATNHFHGGIEIDSQSAEPERLCNGHVSPAHPCVSCGGWLRIDADPHYCNLWGFRVCPQCVETAPTEASERVVAQMESNIAAKTDIWEAQYDALQAKVSSLSVCVERLAASMTQTVIDKVAGHVKEFECARDEYLRSQLDAQSKFEAGFEIKLADLRAHFTEIVELTNEANCSSLSTVQVTLGQFAEKQSENVSKTLRGVTAWVIEYHKRDHDKLLLMLDERLAEMEHRVDIKFKALHFRSDQGPDREQIDSDQVTCIALVKEDGAELPSILMNPKEVQETLCRDWAWLTEISASVSDAADKIVSGEAVPAAVQAQQVDVLFCPHVAGEAVEKLAMDVADKGGRSYLLGPGCPLAANLGGTGDSQGGQFNKS
eukprot:TRINITY_DN278_c0_g1_i1.p1 TRINITY_DN278_c0_g1~~TRINITY_DN278_c0_g1_i1.p1  ORF type:complete len:624 (+),score=83.72 TRINITY_DN278_c0_g1_i1:172-2043(+)